jgi:thiosulfate dehydrogenase [quinone] large subunit
MLQKDYFNMAYNFFRIALGINIFLHGVVRLGPNYEKFHSWVMSIFENSILPNILVHYSAHLIVPLEIVVGGLLIIGVCVFPALLGGLLLMVMLMSGMAFIQKWDAVALQLNYIFFYSILLAFVPLNKTIWKTFTDLKQPFVK